MTFQEQFEQLQKMFDSSDCDIEVLPPDEEKAKKLLAQGGANRGGGLHDHMAAA